MSTSSKPFGPWTLTLLVVANMVGAGVFTTSGYTLQALGDPLWVVLAWGVGGLIALSGAASYGQLARLMPESGGEYLFLSRAAHPLLGFIAGWVSLIAGFSGAMAYAATALEDYVLPASTQPDWLPDDALAMGVIVVASILHGIRAWSGAWLQNLAVVFKLTLLCGFLALVAWFAPSYDWHDEGLAKAVSGNAWNFAAAFAGSLVWISLSYSGFNAAVYVATETRDAERIAPRALWLGTLLVCVLYLLLNTVFVYAPPPEAIAGQVDVAAVAAHALGGDLFAGLVRWTIVLALLTSVLSMMMAGPRVYAKMADDGFLPQWLSFQSDTPRIAIALQMAIAILLVRITSPEELLSYLGLTLSLSAACSAACLFLPGVRSRAPRQASLFLPVVYVVSTFVVAGVKMYNDSMEAEHHVPKDVVGAAITFALGSVAYFVHRTFVGRKMPPPR